MDYNNVHDAAIGPCQRSTTGSSYFQLHNPFGSAYSSQGPRILVPSPPILQNPPATADSPSAYTPRNVRPAIVVSQSDINQNVPLPAANPSRSAISRNLSSRATSCPPFIPSLQSPISTSLPACSPQNTHRPSPPNGHALPGQETRKGRVEKESGKEIHVCYRDLSQRTMKKELRRRGLVCGGLNADLIKRLEKDDIFQAKARTAEDYNTMDPEDVHSLCVRRSIPSNGTNSMLRDRLKAYDERRFGIEAPGPRLRPLIPPSGLVPALAVKGSREMLEEEPLVPSLKDKSTRMTRIAETIGQAAETVTPAIPKDYVGFKPTTGMLPGRNIHKVGDGCHKSKRRCTHDTNSNVNLAKVTSGIMVESPALAVEDLGPRTTRSSASGASTAKASASQSQLREPAQTGYTVKDVKRKYGVPKSRRSQLLYQPEDDIILLQICIELKDVIAWADIPGFWNMVQDTLELKTGKPFRKVHRHIKLLVRKRSAEQEAVKRRGKMPSSRVSAECRPLLDKWIAGGNCVHHASPDTSIVPSLDADKDNLDGDKDTVSLHGEERRQRDSDHLAPELQKRSATDAWLDTSCDTTHCKNLKLCTSEPSYDRSRSSTDSVGCWSLSGSSVTSESSVEDESESGGEDYVKSGK